MSYIVQTATAHMPQAARRYRYRRVAVLEVQPGVTSVAMISTHARGVVRIVRTWERRSVGKTERCAYSRALAEAEALADELNRAESRCDHPRVEGGECAECGERCSHKDVGATGTLCHDPDCPIHGSV